MTPPRTNPPRMTPPRTNPSRTTPLVLVLRWVVDGLPLFWAAFDALVADEFLDTLFISSSLSLVVRHITDEGPGLPLCTTALCVSYVGIKCGLYGLDWHI